MTGGSRVKGTFTDRNGYTHYFSGTLGVSLTPFKSTDAVVTYRADTDLSGSDAFQGTMGTNQFTLNFDKGYTMSGTISQPIPQQVTVTGAGNWLVGRA